MPSCCFAGGRCRVPSEISYHSACAAWSVAAVPVNMALNGVRQVRDKPISDVRQGLIRRVSQGDSLYSLFCVDITQTHLGIKRVDEDGKQRYHHVQPALLLSPPPTIAAVVQPLPLNQSTNDHPPAEDGNF